MPVCDALESQMYIGGFDWSDCLRPTEVLPYIKITLMSVIAIHAEVCFVVISTMLFSCTFSVHWHNAIVLIGQKMNGERGKLRTRA